VGSFLRGLIEAGFAGWMIESLIELVESSS
jgi:hypothetical protein